MIYLHYRREANMSTLERETPAQATTQRQLMKGNLEQVTHSGVLGRLPEIVAHSELNDSTFHALTIALHKLHATRATVRPKALFVPSISDLPKDDDMSADEIYLYKLAEHFTKAGGTPSGMPAHLAPINLSADYTVWRNIIARLSGGAVGESSLLGYEAVKSAVDDDWRNLRAWFNLHGGVFSEEKDLKNMAHEIVSMAGIGRQASSSATAKRKSEQREAEARKNKKPRRR